MDLLFNTLYNPTSLDVTPKSPENTGWFPQVYAPPINLEFISFENQFGLANEDSGVSGTGSSTFGSAIHSGAGESLGGSGDNSIQALVQSGVGNASGTVTGDGTQATESINQNSSGITEIVALGNQYFQTSIQAGSGETNLIGVGDSYLAPSENSGTGWIELSAAGANMVPPGESAGSGFVEIIGPGSQPVLPVFQTSQGVIELVGVGSQNLNSPDNAGLGNNFFGSGGQTLGQVEQSGLVGASFSGTGSQTLINAIQNGGSSLFKNYSLAVDVSTIHQRQYDLEVITTFVYDLCLSVSTAVSKEYDTKVLTFSKGYDLNVDVSEILQQNYSIQLKVSKQVSTDFDQVLDVSRVIFTDFDQQVLISESTEFDTQISVTSVGSLHSDLLIQIQPDSGPNFANYLPEIYPIEDTEKVLRNFLNACSLEFRSLDGLISGLLYLVHSNSVSLDMLELLGEFLDWGYDHSLTPFENRSQLERQIEEYRYRGSLDHIKWVGYILGDPYCEIRERYKDLFRNSKSTLSGAHRFRGGDFDYGKVEIRSEINPKDWEKYQKIINPAGVQLIFKHLLHGEIVPAPDFGDPFSYTFETISDSAQKELNHIFLSTEGLLSGTGSLISEGEIIESP